MESFQESCFPQEISKRATTIPLKVFNFAEKFQMPVIHLLDKAIANSIATCKILISKEF